MSETRDIMGMPITVNLVGTKGTQAALDEIFAYFVTVDKRFSTYKPESEIMQINRGELSRGQWSSEMQEVFELSEKTKQETRGYFDIKKPDGSYDPSGVVKGWAILRAAQTLHSKGLNNFYVDAGGDIASSGKNAEGKEWSVGIRNPFNREEIVKIMYPHDKGVATSGTYIRGQHIYDPHTPGKTLNEVVSLTVIGPDVLEADRFATAAFAMGARGVNFIESLPGFEAYAIDTKGVATMTSGFESYTKTV